MVLCYTLSFMERTWNRTKIICTIGPVSSDEDTLEKMLAAGMDVARLNFSHGTHEQHGVVIDRLRRLSSRKEWPLAVLLDLQGPRIRIGKFAEGKASLAKGAKFTITRRKIPGDGSVVSTSYTSIVDDVRKDDRILLSDGKIELRVLEVGGDDVLTEVITGGDLYDNKGINVPNVSLSIQTISDKDVRDIRFGVEKQVDYIAVSFVRSPDDILQARKIIKESSGNIPLIAKIERPEAVENLDEIIKVSDGIMVARGDLGVELPPEDVPLLQKKIIRKSNDAGVPVITATQMLASMVSMTRPTRAEASDVANAILDGTDAVMLSEETAAGSFPVKAILMMSRIAEKVENEMPVYRTVRPGDPCAATEGAADAVASAVSQLAGEAGAKLICAFTRSGKTALLVSKNRPKVPILAITPNESVFRKINLYWGVEPLLAGEARDLMSRTRQLDDELKKKGKARAGDDVVLVAGYPFGAKVHSNMLLVHRVS